MATTSITDRPVIDVNRITSNNFDVKSFLGDEDRHRIDMLNQDPFTSPIAKEVEDKYKMAAFVGSITSSRVNDIEANAIALRALMNKESTVDTWEGIKNSWRNGRNQLDRAEIRWQEMVGLQPINFDLPPIVQLPTGGDNWFESSLNAATNMLPMMWDTMSSGAKYGLATGLPAAGVAAIAGQVGPQVLLPEEIVTVPGAFIAFGTVGAVYGGAKRATEIEAGLMFDELLQMKGPNGERIDPHIARSIALGVGVVNGLLEVAQIDELIKTIPGAKKLLRKGIKTAISKTIKNKSLLKLASKQLTSYSKTITVETLQELGQESSNIVGGELAKYLRNRADDGDIPHASVDEIMRRYKDTTIQSVQAFSILAAPGHVGSTVVNVIDQQGVKIKDKVAPDQQIGRVIDIRPRVDPKTLAEQAIEPTEVSEEVTALPEEEQIEITKTEKGIEKELPLTVKPRLYIGNVTRRMTKKFAEIFGKEEGDVKPFLEGPFPTKREAIEMTGDQAMGALVMLEASLDQRLNDNLIRTENDLARANADWGDIRELRKVLELPKTTRPFKVVRATKPTVLTVDNVNQRISFSVQMSRADKITTTRIEQLNSVMRRVRKAAKEGFAAARKELRELQYLRKQVQLRKKITKQIKAEPSKNLDPFYTKAIKEIQSAIDFKAKDEKGVKKKAALRKHLEDNPDQANEISEDILESLEKRDIESLSIAQLQQIFDEIKRLSKLGKLKSKLMAKQRKVKLNKMVKAANDTVESARKPKGFKKERASFLRPLRLLDMLDGAKKFAGTLVTMFDTAIQDATNSELTHVDHRQQRGKAKLKELGLSLFHFARRRKVGDITLTVDDMCGIYAGWMNEQSRLALQQGGIEMESGKTLLITEDIFSQVVEGLTNEEKKWAEFVIEEYADNWDRIRNAVIETENRDLGRVTNYTKMRRIGVDKANKDDILAGFDYSDESDYRAGTVQVHDKFTKERQMIPPEYQLPIDTSLTRVWEGEIRKQEHYIALAKLLKDLNAVVNDKSFAENVKGKFGESVYSSLKNYLKRTANPDFYRNFDDIENISRALRKNTAIAFLSYNLLTVAKQAPSLAFYAVNSSFSDLLMSAIQVAVNPKKTLEAIQSHNRQISHAQIVREMEELKHTNKSARTFILRKVGTAGLRGIYEVDRAVRVIGENAVINYQLRQGLSLTEAAKKARQTSLRTQPAAASKDIAQVYASNEVLNWFTMFTNQLNQIYNIATHDIPAAFYNRQFRELSRSVIALSIVATWIWSLQNKELPEDRDDILEALTDQALASLPVIGSATLAGKRGWGAPAPSVISVAAKTSGAIFSGEMDRIMPALFEATAISTGVPFIGIKRVYETAEEQDLWELIGGKK